MSSMPSAHDEYVAAVTMAADAVRVAVDALRQVAERVEEARTELAQVTSGSAIGDLPGVYSGMISSADEIVGRLLAQLSFLDAYASHVSGGISVPGVITASPASTKARPDPATSVTSSGQITNEQVEKLRQQLPAPIGPDDRGRKTHGRWIGPDGRVNETVSGRDDDAALALRQLQAKGIPRKPLRTSDIEMKLAARMAENGVTHAAIVINNVPCKGILSCDTLVPILLPDGSTLTVHGVEPDGTPYVKRFEGGARPWWS